MVVPAHAAAPPLHHPGLDQGEHARAQPHQRHAHLARLAQIGQGRGVRAFAIILHATDHHEVVELGRVSETLAGRDGSAGTGEGRLADTGHKCPMATHLARAVSLVGGQAQAVDEGGERHQREAMQQYEADGERLFRRVYAHQQCPVPGVATTVTSLSRLESS